MSFPDKFTVGYLGAYGPDKGVKYLLQAWEELGYTDAVLRLAGRDSTSVHVQNMVSKYGGGSIEMCGWQDSVSDFYDSLSLYVQPSVTEGFGIEILEAMAHRKPVIASDGAGACFVLCNTDFNNVFPKRNVNALCDLIEKARENFFNLQEQGRFLQRRAKHFIWPNIHKEYRKVWRDLVGTLQ